MTPSWWRCSGFGQRQRKLNKADGKQCRIRIIIHRCWHRRVHSMDAYDRSVGEFRRPGQLTVSQTQSLSFPLLYSLFESIIEGQQMRNWGAHSCAIVQIIPIFTHWRISLHILWEMWPPMWKRILLGGGKFFRTTIFVKSGRIIEIKIFDAKNVLASDRMSYASGLD